MRSRPEFFGVPYRRFAVTSRRTRAELVHHLRESTGSRQGWLRPLPPTTRFVGSVAAGTFRLTPVIKGQNTYAPWIRGQVRQDPKYGTVVEVTMTLHPLAALAIITFLAAPQYLAISEGSGLSLLWLGVTGVFHEVMYFVGFLPEANRAEEWFRGLSTV
jgi:hypothetical protein